VEEERSGARRKRGRKAEDLLNRSFAAANVEDRRDKESKFDSKGKQFGRISTGESAEKGVMLHGSGLRPANGGAEAAADGAWPAQKEAIQRCRRSSWSHLTRAVEQQGVQGRYGSRGVGRLCCNATAGSHPVPGCHWLPPSIVTATQQPRQITSMDRTDSQTGPQPPAGTRALPTRRT
jgi:hypothetical protein